MKALLIASLASRFARSQMTVFRSLFLAFLLPAAIHAAAPADENFDDDIGYVITANTFTLDGIRYTLTGSYGPGYTTGVDNGTISPLNSGTSDGVMMFDYVPDTGLSSVKIEASDGSAFRLSSFSFSALADANVTITPNGGTPLVYASNNVTIDHQNIDLSGNSNFNNITSFTISGANMILDVDDLNFEEPTAAASITSATYDASTGVIIVTGTGMQALGGATNDIDASKLTLTGEGGSTYTLTDTADVEISSATEFTLTLSATDRAAVNLIINKNGTSSTSGTTYNLAAADDWNAAVTSGNSADTTGNGVTASNIAVPAITSATYDASTGSLAVTGTDFLSASGATNDIVANKFTLTGEGGSTYTLTDTNNVELTSGTAFTLTLSPTDRSAVNQIVNKNGTSSTSGTTYNLAAAEDWAAGANAAVTTADVTGNGVTASNVAVPAITSAAYDASTGALVVTGTGFLSASGASNDIVANKFTLTGEGGSTYTLTDTNNVELTSATAFTLTLSFTDRSAVNLIVNKNGTSSTGGTTYNLAAAEDWAAGANAAVTTADVTGNGVTASNVAVPAITSAAYDASTGALTVTGTGFLSASGASNDIVANKFTVTGEGGSTYTLTDTSNVEMTSGSSFTLTLSATDRSGVNQIVNKNGTSSTGGTTYNLAAAEDWAAGADAAVTTADLTGNGITASNVAVPAITSATYNHPTGTLVVTGTGFLKLSGATNDIDVSKLTLSGEGGASRTLTTASVEITSSTSFTVTLLLADRLVVNQFINKNGTSSTSGTTYNLAAAEDWAAGADAAVTVADLTGNGITATVPAPTITSATTYDASTGVLTVSGTGLPSLTGAANDIVANKFTLTGEGGSTYTLTDTNNVELTSSAAFTLALSATDRAAVNLILNKNGTSSTSATTYNLAAAEDWAAGADPAVTTADLTGNGITVSNVAVPAITSATYDVSAGVLVVTGTGFLSASGATNDIVANKFTVTGEGGSTYTLTDTSNVEITSGTAFTLTLSATDRAATNLILNKDGTSSTGGTTYNLAAAEDWAAGTDAAVVTADLTGNGITVSNTNAAPVIANLSGDSVSYTEGASATLIDLGSNATVTDGDSVDFSTGVLTASIITNKQSSEDILGISTAGSVTLSSGTTVGSTVSVSGVSVGVIATSGTGSGTDNLIVTLSANATPARMTTLVRALTYLNTNSTQPDTATRTVRVTVSDGDGGTSANADVTVSVTAVNDAPTLTATGGTPTYTEGGSAVDLFSTVSISTVETGQTITAFTLTIANLANGSSEILRADGTDIALTNGTSGTTATNAIDYSVSVVATTATVTFTKAGGLSTANTQTVIDGLSYRNSSTAPGTTSRVATLTSLADSGGTANGGVDTASLSIAATIAISAVNDAPTVTASGGTTVFVEADGSTSAPVVIDAGLTLADVDSSTLASATVSITGNYQSAEDLLAFTNDGSTMGNIAVTTNTGGVLTLTSAGATATLAEWQAALRSVTYVNSSDTPDTGARTLSFAVNDGALPSSAATKSVSVAATNDTPTFLSLSNSTVNQSAGTNSVVGALSTVDADHSAFAYTLAAGSGDTNNALFNISGANLRANDAATLPAGILSVRIRTTDGGGLFFEKNFSLTAVDDVAPAAPSTPDLATASDSGNSSTDNITNVTTPTFTGTAEASSTVELFRGGTTSLGTTTADGSGNWSLTLGTALPEGTYSITARATDAVPQTGAASAALTVTIDTTASAAPALTAITNDTGASATDQITSDTTLTLSGTGTANETVTVFRNSTQIGTATANGSGAWSFDYTGTMLAAGTHTFTATTTDAAGNTSTASSDFLVEIDTATPSAPVIVALSTDTGASTTDGITSDNTLLFAGTADANVTVTISRSGAGVIGTTTANGTGVWSFDYTATTLADGAYLFTAFASDTAGNASTVSADFPVTIDTTAPSITTQPASGAHVYGSNFTLTVAATDATALTYQWYRSSTALTDSASRTGSTTASLTHSAITMTGFDGAYTVQITDLAGNVTTSNVATIVVDKATAPVVLGSLAQTYTGAARNATATTTPSGLTVAFTYDGSATAPVNAGSYAVVATVNDTIYQGTASGTLVVAKADQTVTFPALGSVTVGTPATLAATASSGLGVTYSVVSGNATLSGTSFTALDANPITLRATQSGNANYNTASADLVITNIAKIAQTIAFATPADRPFAAPSFSLGATASSALTVTYTVVSGPATVAGDTVTLTGIPGVVTITAQQPGNAVYAAAPDVTRSFTVLANYPAPTPDGYAGSVTGGAGTGSQSVTVTTAADFRTHAESTDLKVITVVGILNLGTTPVAVRSNKTIQGADANATLVGCLLLPTGSNNIILRGLNLTNPATSLTVISDANNAVTLAGARGVFITHCSFFDTANHALKIFSGSDNVTVSWSEFYNTHGALTTGSGIVIGGSTETTPIRVSLHHNLWGAGVRQDMPSATYGHVHLYNNVFNTPGNTTGTEALDQSQLLSERNVYTGVANPLTRRHVNTALPIGRILALDNTYTGTTGTAPYAELDQVFTPSYSYEALPLSDIVTVVTANAGNNTGANYTDDATGTAAISGPGAPATPGTSFALNATATGFTPATYQWRRNNVAIPGATSATYNVASAGEIDAAVYTVAIAMSTGDTVVSLPLAVSLNAVPVTPTDMQLKVDGGGAFSTWFLGALALLFGFRAIARRCSEDRS